MPLNNMYHDERMLKMEFLSASEAAELWKVSNSLVRRYLRRGQIPGAFFEDGSWKIPANAVKPGASYQEEAEIRESSSLLKKLIYQQNRNNHFGIYEYLQVNMAYSSCRLANNRLLRNQVETIYRRDRIDPGFEPVKVNDVLEIVNHIQALDYILKTCQEKLTPDYIKKIHSLLTYGTYFDFRREMGVGTLRNKPAKIQDKAATSPSLILRSLRKLTLSYEKEEVDLQKVLDFHVRLERIRPFSDYNGRVGRLIMLKECLRYGLDPFIIDDKRRATYNRGIALWDEDPSVLTDAVLQAQKRFQNQMDTCNHFEYYRPANPRQLL